MAIAMATDLDIDIEDALDPLCPDNQRIPPPLRRLNHITIAIRRVIVRFRHIMVRIPDLREERIVPSFLVIIPAVSRRLAVRAPMAAF